MIMLTNIISKQACLQTVYFASALSKLVPCCFQMIQYNTYADHTWYFDTIRSSTDVLAVCLITARDDMHCTFE